MEPVKLTLAAMRKNKGESVEDVHKATGISASSVYSYENGRREPKLKTILKLLDHYGFGIENLTMKDD